MRLSLKIGACLCAALVMLAGCDSVRSMVSKKNIAGRFYMGGLKDRKFAQLAHSMDKIYAKEVKETGRKKPYVVGQCIMHEVEKAAPTNSYSSYGDWSNMITSEKDVKVATFGGRSIYVSEGLLDTLNYRQDVIAFHIAHAVAHDHLGHTNELLYSEDKPDGTGDLLDAWSGNNPPSFRGFVMGLNGSPMSHEDIRPYSLEMEKEADLIAVAILSTAGFNPNNFLAYMSSHMDHPGAYYDEIHPMTQERFEALAKDVENAAPMRALAAKRNHVPECENLQ